MAFTSTAFLKQGCPHCLRFMIFMTEAGLLSQIDIKEFAQGEESFEQARALLKEHLGKPSFPAIEVEPGKYMKETDDLIEHFANLNDIDRSSLQLLPLYERGVFQRQRKLFLENKQYKEKYGEL